VFSRSAKDFHTLQTVFTHCEWFSEHAKSLCASFHGKLLPTPALNHNGVKSCFDNTGDEEGRYGRCECLAKMILVNREKIIKPEGYNFSLMKRKCNS
jgi:hypothetical protein